MSSGWILAIDFLCLNSLDNPECDIEPDLPFYRLIICKNLYHFILIALLFYQIIL